MDVINWLESEECITKLKIHHDFLQLRIELKKPFDNAAYRIPKHISTTHPDNSFIPTIPIDRERENWPLRQKCMVIPCDPLEKIPRNFLAEKPRLG
mgnify:CR=1 FL=1